MEDFVTRHKTTLESLVLNSCTMYADEWAQGSQRTWSDIWSRFEIELDKLMDLTDWWNVDADIPDEHMESENTMYFILDVCVGYVHSFAGPSSECKIRATTFQFEGKSTTIQHLRCSKGF